MAIDLKKKVGPMPVWAWGATAGALALGVILYERHKSSKTPASANANTEANASPQYAAVPVGNGYGGGYSYSGSYPVQQTTDSSTANQNTSPSHPYMLVSDIADLQQAIQAGIPQSWLAYAGVDPKQSLVATDPTYAPPQGLPSLGSLPTSAAIAYGGAAADIAPDNAIKVYGQVRAGTLNAMKKWYQNFTQYGQNVGYYIPVDSNSPAVYSGPVSPAGQTQESSTLKWVPAGTPGSVPYAGSPTGYAVNPQYVSAMGG